MNDTIVAIGTAISNNAISIIRVSGSDAISKVSEIFKGPDLKTREANSITYGFIVDKDVIVDEVLVSVFKKPKSFTKEDIVEINCHGGVFVTNKILEILLSKNIRLAEPGEFTKRAFLNGRIDLTQAEAVMDVIEAETDNSLTMATSALRGDVRKKINAFKESLAQTIATIEVNIDYPEYETELEIIEKSINPTVLKLKEEIKDILEKAKTSKILKQGIPTAIIGKPNVGKSSLLNALLREEKAIVTEIPGTTRDTVEGKINLGGIILNIIDTAGIRQTKDIVEQLGVKKTEEVLKKAELIILMFDYSIPLDKTDFELLEKTKDKTRLIVINKEDLDKQIDLSKIKDYILLSAKKEEDIEKLELKIKEILQIKNIKPDNSYIANARVIAKLKETLACLESASKGINDSLPIDIINIDLTNALNILGEITGDVVREDVLEQMFSRFCLGK
ncbi:MAG: tRNA uridine-5-carboxymethylaminomethyl(34) synthesis GTPase MnmE [Bacilli bacterium]